MTLRVCPFIRSSSPHPHERHQHDFRPVKCKAKRCYGYLVDCEHGQEYRMSFKTNEEKRRIIAYLRKLKEMGI